MEEAGDDINRYKIDLFEDFHPKGFKVPCCKAPRKGADTYEPNWKVEVLLPDSDGRLEWVKGDSR